jgi:phage gp46-like protein
MGIASPVPDIRTAQVFDAPYFEVAIDWMLLGDGTLDDTQALATAIVVALGTNMLADIDEPLPDPDSTDRGGWWGDLDADTIWNGWDIGSKLWLLRRTAIESVASRQGSTVARVLAYISLAIQPFVDSKVCSRFDAAAERVDKQRIDALITVYRGPVTAIQLRYQILWNELVDASRG